MLQQLQRRIEPQRWRLGWFGQRVWAWFAGHEGVERHGADAREAEAETPLGAMLAGRQSSSAAAHQRSRTSLPLPR